jgi:hypothetical protein
MCAGILPKSGLGRRNALETIRTILNDETLFASEPEFEGISTEKRQ